MNTVWVMTSWGDDAMCDDVVDVYGDFESGADRALKAINESAKDMHIHHEYKTEVKTYFEDGRASYELWVQWQENPPQLADALVLQRYEIKGEDK